MKTTRSRNPVARGVSRVPTALLVTAAVFYVVASNLTPISESDFWIQLKVGDEIRQTGTIPKTIEYTFTEARDREFIAHEWLPSVVTSALYAHVGYAGMIVFKCALALAVVTLAAALAFRVNGSVVVAVLVACASATAMNFRFQMRPEIFAFLLALASLHALTAFLATGRRAFLAGLIPVALIWANSHGSFMVGLALPWIVLAGELADDLRSGRLADSGRLAERVARTYVPLAAIGGSMLAVSLVTPFGTRLFSQVFAVGGAEWLRENIVEFGATFDPRVTPQLYFRAYVAFLAIVVVSFAVGWRRVRGVSLVLALVFGVMATRSIRYTAWFALVGAYVLASNLAWPEGRRRGERGIAIVGIVALLAGIGIVTARGNVRGQRIGFRDEAPMRREALAFVRNSSIAGNVFNTFSHGDQLIHDFYPRIRVVIDSRTDAYGEAYYMRYRALEGRSYKALGAPEDLVAFLDRYHVDTVITRPIEFRNWSEKGHIDALARAGFSMAYSDPQTLILRRGV